MKEKQIKQRECDYSCNGCGIGMTESDVKYTNDDGHDYCNDCYDAIQSDDESSGRLSTNKLMLLSIARDLNKSELQLFDLFGSDTNYEFYKNSEGNIAFRKCFDVGQPINAFEIKTKGTITLKEDGDYYVELADGHGGWFNYKELERT